NIPSTLTVLGLRCLNVFANLIWRALLRSTNPALTPQGESKVRGSRFATEIIRRWWGGKKCLSVIATVNLLPDGIRVPPHVWKWNRKLGSMPKNCEVVEMRN